METVIQKAARGNREAMMLLYEATAPSVYCLSSALLRGSEQSVSAACWAIKSAFQAAEKGMIDTENAFFAHAVKQAAGYCKKEVAKKDPRAFRLPPKKDFRISHVNNQAIDPNASGAENYIQCLPAIQRFTFVLHYMGNLDKLQIGKVLGLDTGSVEMIMEAEGDNLEKICRAVRAAGGHCGIPAKKAVAHIQAGTDLPDGVKACLESYIDSVAVPIEAAAKNKRKKLAVLAGAAAVCVAVLIAVLAGRGNSNDLPQTDLTAEDFMESSVTEAAEETGAAEETSADGALDADTVYYADIEVADYGTITVQLDQSTAPITAANFVALAESGFYDGLTFHRIYSGFMIQGGDPNGDGTGGSGEEIVGEFASNGYENDLSHTRGVISMARAEDYNSASSQFFIVHRDSTFLDGEYAAFGRVTGGMDIVDAICADAVPYDGNGMIYAEDQPVITSVTIRAEAADPTEASEATAETSVG